MSYSYAEHRDWLVSPAGIKAVGEVVERIRTILEPAGAARMHALMPRISGNSWEHMAAVDRCVEMGVIREMEYPPGRTPMGQHRVFLLNRAEA